MEMPRDRVDKMLGAKQIVGCAAGCGSWGLVTEDRPDISTAVCQSCAFVSPAGHLRFAWGFPTEPPHPPELPLRSRDILWRTRLAPETALQVDPSEAEWFYNPGLRRADHVAWYRFLYGNPNTQLPVDCACDLLTRHVLTQNEATLVRQAVVAAKRVDVNRAVATARTVAKVLPLVEQRIADRPDIGSIPLVAALVRAGPKPACLDPNQMGFGQIRAAWALLVQRAAAICRDAALVLKDRVDQNSFVYGALNYRACQAVATLLVAVALPLELTRHETP